MAHRIKNTLAVVQVIAAQTFPSRDVAREKAVFAERLRGLAASHDLLLAEGWQGGDLRRSLEKALTPYRSGSGDRIRLSGEAIELPPQAVLAISMIAHELATNAVKYGALRDETGRIEIGWSRVGPCVTIVWQERDGPPVIAPSSEGFGTKLIRRAFPAGFEPKIELDYLPAGLRCSIAFVLTGHNPP
jgi:two-component sensor histidine kinase